MKRIERHMRKKFLRKVAAVIVLVVVVTTGAFFALKKYSGHWAGVWETM